jgi:hypothetical protein
MDLIQTISTIRERIVEGRYRSESTVREAVLLPILSEMGWDIWNPELVIRELNLAGRRIDYGLAAHPARLDVFVEVKGIGAAGGGDRQLFEYAFHEGVPMAVLTDGREWHFYLPGEQGSYEERRVYRLDFLEQEPADSCRILGRYLGFSRVRSGDAFEDAKQDLRKISRERLASRSIPRAWGEIVAKPPDSLVELIAARTEQICGYRPHLAEVEKFVRSFEGLAVEPRTAPGSPLRFKRNQKQRARGPIAGHTAVVIDAGCRLESNDMELFLSEATRAVPGSALRSDQLYACYQGWARAKGKRAVTQTKLGREMSRWGYAGRRGREGRIERDGLAWSHKIDWEWELVRRPGPKVALSDR